MEREGSEAVETVEYSVVVLVGDSVEDLEEEEMGVVKVEG